MRKGDIPNEADPNDSVDPNNSEPNSKDAKSNTEDIDTKTGFKFSDYRSKGSESMRSDDYEDLYAEFMARPMKTDPAKTVAYENIFMR